MIIGWLVVVMVVIVVKCHHHDGYSPGQGGDGANDGRVGDDDPDIEVFNNNYLSFFSGLTTSPACSNGMSLYSLNVII